MVQLLPSALLLPSVLLLLSWSSNTLRSLQPHWPGSTYGYVEHAWLIRHREIGYRQQIRASTNASRQSRNDLHICK